MMVQIATTMDRHTKLSTAVLGLWPDSRPASCIPGVVPWRHLVPGRDTQIRRTRGFMLPHRGAKLFHCFMCIMPLLGTVHDMLGRDTRVIAILSRRPSFAKLGGPAHFLLQQSMRHCFSICQFIE
jgi:hypothetical protein